MLLAKVSSVGLREWRKTEVSSPDQGHVAWLYFYMHLPQAVPCDRL